MISPGSESHPFALKIERGRTKHPERPISEDRFLIGAGSNCHLQLGGEMPILHSILIQERDSLWIDAIVQEPQLLVNRQPVRESQLHTGDLIEIGEFVFTVQECQTELSVAEEDLTEDENVDLKELSSEDLVDLLAGEMELLENIDAAKDAGAQSLLEAARAVDQTVSEELIKDLGGDEYSERVKQLDRREEILAEKATHLQKAQERLGQYLERLTAKVASESNTDGDNPFRKTA